MIQFIQLAAFKSAQTDPIQLLQFMEIIMSLP
jgi:hypothetical protein